MMFNKGEIAKLYRHVYNLGKIPGSTISMTDDDIVKINVVLASYSEIDRRILYSRAGIIRKKSYEKLGKEFGMKEKEVETNEILAIVDLKPKLPPIFISKRHELRVEQLMEAMEHGVTPALRMELFKEVLSPFKSSTKAKEYYAQVTEINDIELDYYTRKVLRDRGVETLEELLELSGEKIAGIEGAYVARLVSMVHSFGYADFCLAV